MRCGADKSVVKGKSHSLLRGEMCIDCITVGLVRPAKSRKKIFSLCRKVILASDGYKPFSSQIFHILVVADNDALFGILHSEHIRYDLLLVTVK